MGIVFNNTVTGTTYNCKIQLTHERSFRDRGGFGVCDGTNPVDGNQIPAGQKGAGYPCMGQPGRGTDADGDGVFEPSPCYAWNNTLNGAKLNMALRRWGPKETERQAEHVKEGRDFFNEKPPEPDTTSPTSIRIRCKASPDGWAALLMCATGFASASDVCHWLCQCFLRTCRGTGPSGKLLASQVQDAANLPFARYNWRLRQTVPEPRP